MMKKVLRTVGAVGALAAASLSFAQSSQARDEWGRRDGGDTAAIAIGAGILGLALGAAIADRGDDRYYDRRYYSNRRYVTVRDHPGYYYYYDGFPGRYYQDRYYGRPNVNGRYANRWDRGYANNRWNQGYSRGYAYDRSNRGGYPNQNRGGWSGRR